jgi:hypothetical protein
MKYHPVQSALWKSPHRFNIIPSGRRSGKTEICGKRKIIRAALNVRNYKYPDPRFGIGAPTREQVKRIYWNDIKSLIHPKLIRDKSETELTILLWTGASISLVGLDKPERAEGVPWDGFVLDEYGNTKASAWTEHIRPALADRRGWADFIGVPEGRNHYYELDLQAQQDTTGLWGRYHWISADILHPDEILAAKQDLDEMTYRQEFEGSFLSFQGNAYYAFSDDNKQKNLHYSKTDPLIVALDFNVSPGVAVVAQETTYFHKQDKDKYKESVTKLLGEVYVERNSNTQIVTEKFIDDWKHHEGPIYCYGDATGGNLGSAKLQGSDWEIVKRLLYKEFGRDRVYLHIRRKNPPEKVRLNSVNSRVKSIGGRIGLLVDPAKCKHTIRDFEGVTLVKGSNGVIDKKTDPKLTHLTDAIGYYIDKVFPIRDYVQKKKRFWK